MPRTIQNEYPEIVTNVRLKLLLLVYILINTYKN